MQCYFTHIKKLALRLSYVLIAFFLTRLYFFLTNYSQFADEGIQEIFMSFIGGIRFDWASIAFYNYIFIILSIIPGRFKNNKYYQIALKLLFIIINSAILLANVADAEFFKFTQKRATFDIFKTEGGDFFQLLPRYIIDYWYVFFISGLFVFAFWKMYPKIKCDNKNKLKTKTILFQSLLSILILLIIFISYRGLRRRPVSISSAAKYVSIHNIPLVLNTPFTMFQTVNKKTLDKKEYFSTQQLKSIYDPIKKFSSDSINKKNVVIIILESFSKEYSSLYGNKIGYTPFLDSLSKRSLYFKYSFANGKRSMEALSSIIGSIPTLSNTPFIVSQFSSNYTQALASLLSEQGYHTAFFHGGINGTMDFDNYAHIAGFKEYYGKDEYNDDKDYDGNWGIFDEPFLQFFARKNNEFNEPFLSTVFTLSSHHPYTIPEQHANRFPKGTHPIHESVAYSDYALSEFFKTAKTMPWYNNTLFVITADHTAASKLKNYKSDIGKYSVPIIFYSPNDTLLNEMSNDITQHIDIMPSILDYLNYNEAFYSFGSSVFNQDDQQFSINFLRSVYQFTYNDYLILYYDENIQKVYNFKKDSLLKNDLVNNEDLEIKKEVELLKAIIQTYNNGMVDNKISVRK